MFSAAVAAGSLWLAALSGAWLADHDRVTVLEAHMMTDKDVDRILEAISLGGNP